MGRGVLIGILSGHKEVPYAPSTSSDPKHQLKGFADEAGNAFVRSVKRRLGKEYGYSIFGERKPAHEVATEIFCFLRDQARKDYNRCELDNVVLTVPVKFHGAARLELRKAASAAGIELKTFIHEPPRPLLCMRTRH